MVKIGGECVMRATMSGVSADQSACRYRQPAKDCRISIRGGQPEGTPPVVQAGWSVAVIPEVRNGSNPAFGMPSRHVRLAAISSLHLSIAERLRSANIGGRRQLLCYALASAGVHTFGLDHRSARWRHQVGDESLRSFRFFAVCSDTRCVDDFPLYFGGERTDHVQAGICQHVDEKHRELGVATRNRLDDLRGRGLRLGLAYHRLCDTKTLVYT